MPPGGAAYAPCFGGERPRPPSPPSFLAAPGTAMPPTDTPAIPHPRLLQALETGGATRELARVLARAAQRSHLPATAAAACARLAPAETVSWLLAVGEAAGELLTDAETGALLDALADEARERGDAALAELVCEAAGHHPHAVRPETVVALGEVVWPERSEGSLAPLCDHLLGREPRHPGLLRLAAGIAVERGDGPRAHALLDRLGTAAPYPADAAWAMRARARLPASPGAPLRVALLGSFTLDPLVPYLDAAFRAAGIVPQVHAAPFGAWEREVADPAAALWGHHPELAVLAVSLDDLVPALAGDPPADTLRAAGAAAVERVAAAAERVRERSSAVLAVLGFHTAFPGPPVSASPGESRAAWIAGLDTALGERLSALPDAWLVEMREVVARRPGGAPDDPKLRHLARMRIPSTALAGVARALAGVAVAVRGLTRKCVVVDLDNTLWGGLAGEDGIGGVRLGDTAPGSEFVELQRHLKALAGRGILLAAVSKNNEADALEVIRGHDAMVLREEDFAAMRLNWLPKHENVLSIAAELGIGTDALVFVDDNPDERDLMRQMLPEVLTPELPADPALFRRTLEELPQLRALRVTGEDRERAALYRARAGRQRARGAAGGMDEYLRSLEVEVEAGPTPAAALSRVHQLFARTNQFNLTSRRPSFAELSARAADPGWRLFSLTARDRFGEHGLVAAALVRAEEGTWTVDGLVLSCRAIGYGVETALLATVCDAARAAGALRLEGEFVETSRNLPARGFWARHGFALRGREDGVERWERGIAAGGVAVPEWIRLRRSDAS